MLTENTLENLATWLDTHVGIDKVKQLIPAGHPAIIWRDSNTHSSREELAILIEVLAKGGHLPLLSAIVHISRIEASQAPPAMVDYELGLALQRMDELLVSASSIASCQTIPDLFISYAHEDSPRVDLICKAIIKQGLRVFRDIENIPPGTSIAGTIAFIAETSPASIVVVSEASNCSYWVEREIAQLQLGRVTNSMDIYPIVIDNVNIPPSIRDIYAIDLRGLESSSSSAWVEKKLDPLIQEIQRKR